MRTNVLLVEFGVELDLTRDDLGQPDLPGLWERLHRNCHEGTLRCIDPEHPDGAPPWLYLRQNEDGSREARHISGVEHRTASESAEHKALRGHRTITRPPQAAIWCYAGGPAADATE